jgi:predicted P-loop ATPase
MSNSVTVFKNIKQTEGGEDFLLSDVMDAVKGGHWKKKINYYRSLPENNESEIKAKKTAKTSLPYFTGSGTFSKRKDTGLKAHSGRLILDIDYVEDPEEVKKMVGADPFTEYCFTSVGGEGVAVIVKIDPTRHLESWKALSVYYKNAFGLPVDKATKDLSRARFVSYDPKLIYNENSRVFILQSKADTIKNRCKKLIVDAPSGEVHNNLIKSSRLMGGYIAGGLIDEAEAEEFLVDIMSKKEGVVSIDIERKKIQDGIANGKLSPITAEQIDTKKKQSAEDKKAWKEIFSFIHAMNRAGRDWTKTDVLNLCEIHLISDIKVTNAFTKIYKENIEEFGIDDKPEIYKVEVWLRKNWDFAKNEITQTTEAKTKEEKNFETINIDSIYRKLQHVGFKFPFDKLKSLFKSDFVSRYNPFINYFEGLPVWDGKKDYIAELAGYVTVEDQDFFLTQFKKALVRCIGCGLYSRENRIVFVLVGEKQSTGKSTFIRFLNPFGAKYYTEAPLHNNKDSSFSLAENFIYNLEELASLTNVDVNRLKSIISTASIKERKAYATDALEQPRRVNFWGSTNKNEFLTDTENTRWLCFNLLDMDWGYTKNVDIHKVWAQAFALYKDPKFSDQLTKSEAEDRDRKNKGYEINDYEKELIKRHFKYCESNEGEFFSNADILEILEDGTKKLNSRFIGKNMIQLGFERGVRKINNHTVRGYFAKRTAESYKVDDTIVKKKVKPF